MRNARMVTALFTTAVAVSTTLLTATPAHAQAPQCTSSAPTFVGGSIYGYPDNYAVNALIGFDLVAGTTHVKPDGSTNTSGYGYSQRVNQTLPATGSPTGVKTWGICVASSITEVHREVYPQNPLLATDRSRYGGASHYRQPITSGADDEILLRLPVRYEVAYNETG